jgi:hypothetical protein
LILTKLLSKGKSKEFYIWAGWNLINEFILDEGEDISAGF